MRTPGWRAATLLGLAAALSSTARADEVDDVLARFRREPSVRDLQTAAAQYAQVHPERIQSLQDRIRLSALAPSLRLRVGHGARVLDGTVTVDGVQRLTISNGDNWMVDVGADWNLSKLVFNPEELRLSREAQRVASRREALLTQVAHLYFERRRLQVRLALEPPDSPAEALDARLQIDELGAILDGLTGGALTRRGRRP